MVDTGQNHLALRLILANTIFMVHAGLIPNCFKVIAVGVAVALLEYEVTCCSVLDNISTVFVAPGFIPSPLRV